MRKPTGLALLRPTTLLNPSQTPSLYAAARFLPFPCSFPPVPLKPVPSSLVPSRCHQPLHRSHPNLQLLNPTR